MADTENTRAPAGSEPTALELLDEMKDASAIASHGDHRERDSWKRYDEAERKLRALLASAPAAAPLPLTDRECWERGLPDSIDRAMAYEAAIKTEQMYDREGVTLESAKPFEFVCCDCGLTHRMVIASEDGKPVGFAVERDQARTAQQRSVRGTPAAGEPHPCRFFNGKCIDCGRSWGAGHQAAPSEPQAGQEVSVSDTARTALQGLRGEGKT